MKKSVYLLILFLLSILLSSCGKVELNDDGIKLEHKNLKVNLNDTGVNIQTKNGNIKADDNGVKIEGKKILNNTGSKNDSGAKLEEKLKNSLKNVNNQNPSTNSQDKNQNTVDLDSGDEEALKIIDSLNSILDE